MPVIDVGYARNQAPAPVDLPGVRPRAPRRAGTEPTPAPTATRRARPARARARRGADLPLPATRSSSGSSSTSRLRSARTVTRSPEEVRARLERIPDADVRALGLNPRFGRPEWMVLTVLPVLPVEVRPSITLESGERSEDDLTHKLVDVLRINQRLRENRDMGAPQLVVEDLWQLLQYHVTMYFDNQTSGIPPARTARAGRWQDAGPAPEREGRPFRRTSRESVSTSRPVR